MLLITDGKNSLLINVIVDSFIYYISRFILIIIKFILTSEGNNFDSLMAMSHPLAQYPLK